MSDLTKKAVDVIRKVGLKPTAQRVETLEFLYSNKNYQSIDTIFNSLLENYKVFSKATIHSTLEIFVEKGIVSKFYGLNGEARIDVSGSNHTHFICEKCGLIDKIKTYNVDDDITRKSLDYEITSKETTYKGLCNKCKDER
ncbi:MAG: Fur family transcriptional regulator peroxide stress response regulator [Fusobacteria bacterium]|nr:MAG: Fur family transcriptional regulator peroxide stress response regulator [Fusobacteriota bacterium]KAF0228718.1 MAG: Fur family transcriptional regulator peroxide stress response [Fusobacteriota bacterium]